MIKNTYKKTEANRVKRGAKRATYDVEQINAILDDGFLCHAGYYWQGETIVIPTIYGRIDNKLYLHGAMANRMLNSILDVGRASLTVTHLDGLVLARSAFHHSANYRTAVIFGDVKKVEMKVSKMEALHAVMEQMLPGRWDECRLPNEKELRATLVLEIAIDYASAKVRKGDPADDLEDYDLKLWAGVLPVKQEFKPPVKDSLLKYDISTPNSIEKVLQ